MTQKLPTLFNSIEALDAEKHKTIKFNAEKDYSHTKNVHFIPTVLGEVPLLTNTYPIVFAPTEDGKVMLAVVLGMVEGENGYLDTEDKWMAEYIPAYVRRYPFIGVLPSDAKKGEKVLCLDVKAPHFLDKKGEKLFDAKGKPSELLQHYLRTAEEYDFSESQTLEFCQDVQDSNILEDWQEGGKHGSISFKRINVDALQNLSGDKIGDWHKKGYLTSILNIVQSQRSWRELEARLNVTKVKTKK